MSFVAITTAATVAKRCVQQKCQLLKLTGRVCRFTTSFVGAQHYTGKETVWCFQQFSPGAPVGWCTVSYNSLCSETSTICLPAIFSFFFLLWKQLVTLLSLVSCQKGAWRRAFFSEEFLKRCSQLQKDAGGGVLKSAQDFCENTVYSIG